MKQDASTGAARIVARLDELNGASDDEGALTRLTLSPAHARAAAMVRAWMEEAGLSVRLDSVGNVVGRREGASPGAKTLIIGSHIDSVRNAGRFDGPLGVILGVEACARLAARAKAPPFAIEVVAFGDEEGVRFPTSLTGSRALAGTFDPASLESLDARGVSRRDALLAFGCDPSRAAQEARDPASVLGYVELHIEQGPVLESKGLALGLVTAINGGSRGEISIEGSAGHAGTLPMTMRHDALAAAAEIVLAIEAVGKTRPDLVATVGRLEVPNGAVNVVPGRARLSIDVRSPRDEDRLQAVEDIRARSRAHRDGPRREGRSRDLLRHARRTLRQDALDRLRARVRAVRSSRVPPSQRGWARRHGVPRAHSAGHGLRALPRRRQPPARRVRIAGRYRGGVGRAGRFSRYRWSRVMTVIIDGASLTGADVARVCRRDASGAFAKVALDKGARERVMATRAWLDANFMNDDAPLMYSFNTGVGLFKDQRVLMKDMIEYQTKSVYAHATGVGEPFAEDVARATMLLRANAFASNYSGPRVEVLDRLIDCLNAGVTPVIPQKGSVGASGDLAPLAHMSGAICGFEEAEMFWQGRRMPAREALAAAGLLADLRSLRQGRVLPHQRLDRFAGAGRARHRGFAPHPEGVRRGARHVAGMPARRARRVRGAHSRRPSASGSGGERAQRAAHDRWIEALLGARAPRRVSRREPRPLQAARAARAGRLFAALRPAGARARARGDPIRGRHHRRRDRIRRPTTRSCFDDGQGGYEIISGGHFHGQYVAQAMDVLAIAMADLGSISERRLARLVDPTMSYGLPRNLLAGKRGLNTGFATVQCSMSALVMENRTLSMPGSVDSHPRQVERRGPRLELHLVRTQDAHDRRERRADRRRRNPDGGAGADPRRGRGEGSSRRRGHERCARGGAQGHCPCAVGR